MKRPHPGPLLDFTLDAEFFDIRTAKLPTLLSEEDGEKLTERLELATRASHLADTLVQTFITARISGSSIIGRSTRLSIGRSPRVRRISSYSARICSGVGASGRSMLNVRRHSSAVRTAGA